MNFYVIDYGLYSHKGFIMNKYAVTFRLKSTETYQDRYAALRNKAEYVDDTTSTLYFDSNMNIDDFIMTIANQLEIIKSDVLSVIQLNTENSNIRKWIDGEMYIDLDLANWLKS